jgi:transposase
MGLEVAPHPPNKPDLAPSDFRLSAALYRHLEGFHCTYDEDDQADRRKWFREEPQGFYSNEFKNPVKALAAL